MCKSPAANRFYLEIVLRLRLWSALYLVFRYSVDLAENAISIMNTHDQDVTIHHVFFLDHIQLLATNCKFLFNEQANITEC